MLVNVSPTLPHDTLVLFPSSVGSSDIFRVSINEDTPPVAGEPYTLTCQVNGTGGTPSIEWVGPNSQPIVNGSGITVGDPVTVGTVTTSSLMFSAISLFDNGRYMCRNDLVFPSTATRTVRVNGESGLVMAKYQLILFFLHLQCLSQK